MPKTSPDLPRHNTVRVDFERKLLYDYIMENNNFNLSGKASLPKCRTVNMPEELRFMTEAVLSDMLSFTEEGDFEYTAEGGDGTIVLSERNGESRIIPRPVTAETMRSAALELISRECGTLQFSADSHSSSAVLGEESVRLTPTEFKLYSAILENGGRLSSAEELSRAVWGTYDRNLCTVYLSYLRRKLDGKFGDGTLICIRGKGYRLRRKARYEQ